MIKDGKNYIVVKGEKNASCYPCVFEGSIGGCPKWAKEACGPTSYLQEVSRDTSPWAQYIDAYLEMSVEELEKEEKELNKAVAAWGYRSHFSLITIYTKRDLVQSVLRYKRIVEPALKSVEDLISGSRGVYGLHLNGDPAPWESLRTGGEFESWLIAFDKAVKVK